MSSKLLQHRGALCNMVRRVAEEAGELLLEHFDNLQNLSPEQKADGSPVTIADREAENLIEEQLRKILPDIPFIGEEAVADGRIPDLSDQDYFWLVDPLDGTRAFLRGDADFTVNIALIHKGDPVLGVIYAPEHGELYAGYRNEDGSMKAFRYFEDTENEKELFVRRSPREGLIVLASSDHSGGGDMQSFLEGYKISKIIKRPSSIKFCAIANGKADLYVRFGPTGEWDTAAGDAILRAAGGIVKTIDGNPFTYGQSKDFKNPHFFAAAIDL